MRDFSFYFPIEDLRKSLSTEEGDWIIRGIASAPNQDIQGEFLDPKGMDTGNLKYFNYDHKQDPKYIVGEITKHWIDDLNRFWVEGIIYKTSVIGKQIVDLAKTLAKESKRGLKLGFSVEGSILERDTFNKTHITKSVVNSIAIAPFPVNATTWAEVLTKSINPVKFNYEMESPGVFTSCVNQDGKWVCINEELQISSHDTCSNLSKAIITYLHNKSPEKKDALMKAIMAGNVTGAQVTNQVTHGEGLKTDSLSPKVKSQTLSFEEEILEHRKKIKRNLGLLK